MTGAFAFSFCAWRHTTAWRVADLCKTLIVPNACRPVGSEAGNRSIRTGYSGASAGMGREQSRHTHVASTAGLHAVPLPIPSRQPKQSRHPSVVDSQNRPGRTSVHSHAARPVGDAEGPAPQQPHARDAAALTQAQYLPSRKRIGTAVVPDATHDVSVEIDGGKHNAVRQQLVIRVLPRSPEVMPAAPPVAAGMRSSCSWIVVYCVLLLHIADSCHLFI